MLPASGWLYLGAYSVWESEHRLTIPPSVFDEYEILLRDRGGWWIFEEDDDAIQISNRAPTEVIGPARYAELSEPGDGSKTRFFTIPNEFRSGGNASGHKQGSTNESPLPEEFRLDHQAKIHFISATTLLSGNTRSLYLFTRDQLERKVSGNAIWANDPKSIARLQDSEIGHLISEDRTTSGTHPVMSTEVDGFSSNDTPLERRLEIEQGDVPAGFSIKYATVEIEGVPPEILSNIDLNYLLVRYGTSETTRQNPAENPELVKILNKEVSVETTYSEAVRTIVAEVPFCVHDRHAAEFKFFADVSDPDLLSHVQTVLSNSSSCNSASISASLEDRVYLVHGGFPTTETDGGFVNNVIYPK